MQIDKAEGKCVKVLEEIWKTSTGLDDPKL
jgi:hypothetical protein